MEISLCSIRSQRCSSSARGTPRRRTLGIGLPAVKPSRQFLTNPQFLSRIGRIDHALGQCSQLLPTEHPFGIETVGKLNDFRLFARRQTLDFTNNLARTHLPNYIQRREDGKLIRVHWRFSFGAKEATIFSKRGSPRSGSQKGMSLSIPQLVMVPAPDRRMAALNCCKERSFSSVQAAITAK